MLPTCTFDRVAFRRGTFRRRSKGNLVVRSCRRSIDYMQRIDCVQRMWRLRAGNMHWIEYRGNREVSCLPCSCRWCSLCSLPFWHCLARALPCAMTLHITGLLTPVAPNVWVDRGSNLKESGLGRGYGHGASRRDGAVLAAGSGATYCRCSFRGVLICSRAVLRIRHCWPMAAGVV